MGTLSCSQPQPAQDNVARDGRSNCLVTPPTLHRAVPPELHVLQGAMPAGEDLLQPVRIEGATFGMPAQRTACAATQGTIRKYTLSGFITL